MMKFKFILSAAVLAGTAVTGFADGYQDGVEYYQVGQGENAKIVLDQTINDPETNKAVAYYYLGNIALARATRLKPQNILTSASRTTLNTPSTTSAKER